MIAESLWPAECIFNWKHNVWPEVTWQALPRQVKAPIVELVLGVEEEIAINISDRVSASNTTRSRGIGGCLGNGSRRGEIHE